MIILSGCGGGGSSDNNQPPTPSTPPVSDSDKTPIAGGSASSPNAIKLNSEHLISENSFFNYFKYQAVAGEKLIIHAQLRNPLSDQEKARCAANEGRGSQQSSYGTQIHIFDSKLNRVDGICGEDITFTAPTNGTYIIQPDYSSNRSGTLSIASIIGASAITSPSGTPGNPSSPVQAKFNSSNPLSDNTFNNYYTISANKGNKIVIQTSLNIQLNPQQNSRCAADLGTGINPSSYDTQIHIYNNRFNRISGICGEKITFNVPENGNYIFHFNFGKQSSGHFNAAILPN